MKTNLGSKGGLANLPPEKKRVLAIGGIAFIILLFVSFLLSLTEDDSSSQDNNANQAAQVEDQAQNGPLQLPSAHRYDFENNTQHEGGGLESLLNDAPESNSPIGVDKSPFDSKPNTVDAPTAPGPLPVPDEDEEPIYQTEVAPSAPVVEEKPAKAVLYCDSYASAADAETQKATLAFQGVTAKVVKNQDGTHGLKLGPFPSAQRAREAFTFLSDKGLLQQCGLIQE